MQNKMNIGIKCITLIIKEYTKIKFQIPCLNTCEKIHGMKRRSTSIKTSATIPD